MGGEGRGHRRGAQVSSCCAGGAQGQHQAEAASTPLKAPVAELAGQRWAKDVNLALSAQIVPEDGPQGRVGDEDSSQEQKQRASISDLGGGGGAAQEEQGQEPR